MDEFDDKELSKALKLGQKERRKEANLAATMCTAISELGMVEREGLTRTCFSGRPAWARSPNGRVISSVR